RWPFRGPGRSRAPPPGPGRRGARAPPGGGAPPRLGRGRGPLVFPAPAEPPGQYRLVGARVLPFGEPEASRLAAAIPLVPGWSEAPDGLAAILVPDHEPATAAGQDPFRYRAGDPVLVWAGYRNQSPRAITLRYRDWPLASHTHWDLRVERVGAGVVAPVAHPHVDQAAIRDFFSRNPHTFDLTLKPGEAFFLFVDRINSAEPGWGYKERLDFQFYPMSTPGEYPISAIGRFYPPGTALATRALRVWVE